MKAIMTGVAVAALIAASPVLAAGELQIAQATPEAEQPLEMQNSAACPEGATETAEGEPCTPTAAAPAGEETQQAADEDESGITTGSLPEESETDAAAADEPQGESTDMVAAEAGKFIVEQDIDALLASELIGLTVYNAADEALGDVNDIVWTDDGGVLAVVVGVGGFLGIGEKAVAVNFEEIEIYTDENGQRQLVLNASEDELAAAPEFVTAQEKLAMIRAEQERALAPATGSATAPAPLAPASQPSD